MSLSLLILLFLIPCKILNDFIFFPSDLYPPAKNKLYAVSLDGCTLLSEISQTGQETRGWSVHWNDVSDFVPRIWAQLSFDTIQYPDLNSALRNVSFKTPIFRTCCIGARSCPLLPRLPLEIWMRLPPSLWTLRAVIFPRLNLALAKA